MEKTVSAADANRSFSRILGGVRKGRKYVVTSHGEPVARIVPAEEPDRLMIRARNALFARLRAEPVARAARWTRKELYEDI